MGYSWWDQVWVPLSIGVASQFVFIALCLPIVRLRDFIMKQIATCTAVGESAHDQPLPDGDATSHTTTVRDSEMVNGHGPAEGGQSTPQSELAIAIGNGREGIEHFSDQEAHTRVSSNRPQDPGHKRGNNRGVLVRPAEMDVPHSQQEEVK